MLYENVKSVLRSAGITVKLPGQYEAPCKESYVVIQNGGTYSYAVGTLTGYTLLYIRCYVPLSNYGKLQPLLERVKTALFPLTSITPTGNEGIHQIDNTYQAHTSYVEYQVMRTLKEI